MADRLIRLHAAGNLIKSYGCLSPFATSDLCHSLLQTSVNGTHASISQSFLEIFLDKMSKRLVILNWSLGDCSLEKDNSSTKCDPQHDFSVSVHRRDNFDG